MTVTLVLTVSAVLVVWLSVVLWTWAKLQRTSKLFNGLTTQYVGSPVEVRHYHSFFDQSFSY